MITPEEITLYLICINQRHICIFKTLIKLAPQINVFTEHVKSHNETWSYRRKETLWMITQQIWNYMYIVIMFISFGLHDFLSYTILCVPCPLHFNILKKIQIWKYTADLWKQAVICLGDERKYFDFFKKFKKIYIGWVRTINVWETQHPLPRCNIWKGYI